MLEADVLFQVKPTSCIMPTDRTGIGTGHVRGLNVSEGVSLLLAGVATLSTIPKELTQIVPA